MRILSFSTAHDSAVCSLVDGELEFFCKEERLSRIKRDMHPFKSLELYKSLNLGKIDHILYNIPSNNQHKYEFLYKNYIEKIFNKSLENYSNLNHHRCHASLAFYNSGFEEALVIVVDRNGSLFFINNDSVASESESIFLCSYPNNFEPLYKSFWLDDSYLGKKSEINTIIKKYYPTVDIRIHQSHGIVKVYEAATTLINQHPLENGKTMGLSAYGNVSGHESLFVNDTVISDRFSSVDTEHFKKASCFFGLEDRIASSVNEYNFQFYANKADQVQQETQAAVLNLIKKYTEKTKVNNVCVVGGYGLNILANSYYINNLPDINFYFEPVSDDTGIPIGAAMLKYRTESQNKQVNPIKNNFYHYYNNKEILNAAGMISKKSNIDDIVKLLIDQKSVAIFDGAPEAGPRALGHRSILFDARNPNSKDIVNKIKKREWYRPFAGVILEEQLGNHFVPLTDSSKYMTINFTANKETVSYVPGIIHADETSRMQTVNEGFLFNLLTEYFTQTGCPMLLNTSFNLAGQPLVQTKQDAIDTLKNSSLDYVYFVDESLLVKRENIND
jgi:carbamoyltransferase